MELRHLREKLFKLQNIHDAHIPAFWARIRHFMDNGVPDLEGVGKGARKYYNEQHLLELHLGMTLQNLGLPIGDAISVVQRSRGFYINSPGIYLNNLEISLTPAEHFIFIAMGKLRAEVDALA